MRKTFFLFVLLSLSSLVTAQILKPVTFTTEAPSGPVNAGAEVELTFKASIIKNWYMYTMGFDPDCGPLPLEITFEDNEAFELVGNVVAIKDKGKRDNIFECDVRYFEGSGEFKQKIRPLQPGVLKIKASFEGQACSNVDGQCVPIDGDLVFSDIQISGKAISGSLEKPATVPAPDKKPDPKDAPRQLSQSSLSDPQPASDTADVAQDIPADATIKSKNTGPILDPELVPDDDANASFWAFFLLSFLAGIAALLTPCVFPMIPMTVSYFTAPGRTRFQAILYGLSIIGIYTLVGAALAPLMGPETANHLSTEWLPNIIFFLVFIVFGLAFLGLFDITLPGTFITRVDRQADRGGLIGVFFMAFTLVLVSFSCTGPIVGSILVSSAGGEFLKPIIGMFGFALAFAIPFTLFAFFPQWLNSLPKSGGWLNSVKVVLGFLEIALAFKFLSIADQTFHWRLLDRELNIAI